MLLHVFAVINSYQRTSFNAFEQRSRRDFNFELWTSDFLNISRFYINDLSFVNQTHFLSVNLFFGLHKQKCTLCCLYFKWFFNIPDPYFLSGFKTIVITKFLKIHRVTDLIISPYFSLLNRSYFPPSQSSFKLLILF